MQQLHSYHSSYPEVDRLLTYIGHNTIDSERLLPQMGEILTVVNGLI